jgi:deoxycytidylate deaminase
MQFLLARHDEDESRMELGLQLLHYFSAEDNGVMRKWKKLGEEPKNSSESQAFLHLFNVYCSRKQCLNCAVGAQLLKQHESSKVFF